MFSASKTAVPSGYNIANSLRFRSSASAYLSRTPSVAGNRQTWTWSGWVKRGSLGGNQGLFSVAGTTDATYFLASISSDTIYIGNYSTVVLATTQVLRDPSAWYHLVIVLDTTQATANNRLKLYLNGIQITAFSNNNIATYYTQNSSQGINQTASHSIGRETQGSVYYFDGYLANIDFIDGQALPPTAFGTINKENGVWSPIAYTGTYGTNGFKLNFSNGTSTTTLGYDSSGNGNNWTTNNISLTAGSTYDWMIDSPTKYPGSSYGVGNYCVGNPLQVQAGGSFSDGNLTVSIANGFYYSRLFGTIGVSSGKWYWEFTQNANSATMCGIASSFHPATPSSTLGYYSDEYAYYGTGQKYNNGSLASYGSSYTTNDVLGVALDLDAGTLTFYKNNTSQGVAFSSLPTGTYFPALGSASGTSTGWWNFGQRPFAYTPPSGYKSLCTFNLPGPSINNGASYMAATTYTGNGSTQSINNAVNSVSFQPDFVWVKDRTTAYGHILWDSIRGVSNYLSSSSPAAEGSYPTGLTSLNSNGFTLGSGTTTNGNGDAFIGWQWKAGGTAVTNTAGSITSSVSANPTAGFSVVTYTGTGSAATVGHGLGVAPSMVIVKRRDSATNGDWFTYHISLGNTNAVFLNLTNASSAGSMWNNTTPTSSVISIGTSTGVNALSSTYVAYCFAAIPGYSAFGSYTGNGSTNGPFVYCGFRPRFVLVKRTDAADSWGMFDSSRDAYNAENALLRAESSNAEASMTSLVGNPFGDFLSNGFKVRNTSTLDNASGGTYIYAAFAENPFTNALAR